jgi:hypothetical protein
MSGRYGDAERRVYVSPRGIRTVWLAPRILPQPTAGGPGQPPAITTTVADQERDRLDNIAFRTLRDPLQAWRISDANSAMDPFALCAKTGTVLIVPPVGL